MIPVFLPKQCCCPLISVFQDLTLILSFASSSTKWSDFTKDSVFWFYNSNGIFIESEIESNSTNNVTDSFSCPDFIASFHVISNKPVSLYYFPHTYIF